MGPDPENNPMHSTQSIPGDLRRPVKAGRQEFCLPEEIRTDVVKMRVVLHRLVDIVADAGYLQWMTQVAESWCSQLSGELAAAYLCADLRVDGRQSNGRPKTSRQARPRGKRKR